MSCFSP